MSNRLIKSQKVKGPIDPDSGFSEVLMTANLEAIMQKKAVMLQEFQESEEGVRKRSYTAPKTGEKVEYIVRQSKPYSLFSIEAVVGKLPNALSGKYTSFDQADKAITAYLATRKESYYDEVIAREHDSK